MQFLRRLLFASFVLATPALAQVNPLVFERATIRIDPVAIEKTEKNTQPAPPREPSNYDVEVRSEEAMGLEYIHTLNTLTESTGVAIVFNAPSMVSLPRMQVFTSVDALFVAEDGTVLQIYPNVTLASMQQEVIAKDPVKAFLFLKAGQVAAKRIMPRDIISGGMFTPAPPVMQ
jgi:hypothetical protein